MSVAPHTLASIRYRTVSAIKGPLLFVERVAGVGYDEIVEIQTPDGDLRQGRVLEISGRHAVIQVFGSTSGLNLERTSLQFTGDVARLNVSRDLLGRVLDGLGDPIDDGPSITPDAILDLNGIPMNPAHRLPPSEFIQTGISAIDGLNTLARGQKLPIFSGAGLPANRLAVQIARQAQVTDQAAGESFAVVFAAIGVTQREVAYFVDRFRASESLERAVLVINRADEPSALRLIAPRAALTIAEYLAYQCDLHVLVILTDMTNYCEALREVASAREEIPGRRGYPGYMYSDLASIYERAGRLTGRPGSLTQLVILTMPNDDITHPIADLSGYITEGQIVLGRDLHQRGVFPPVEILPSLSRQMNAAIKSGRTRPDHRAVANELYSLYARGCDLRQLAAIIGENAIDDPQQRQILQFATRLEEQFLNQGDASRSIEETLDLAWDLMRELPASALKRIPDDLIQRYHQGANHE